MSVDNVIFSIAALEIGRERGIKITPTDLQMINFLKNNEKMTKEQITESQNLDLDLVEFTLDRLKKQKLATTSSPQWVLTTTGKEVAEEFDRLYPIIKEKIKEDPYLDNISNMSVI